jgi:hypothetical protein
LIAFDRDVKHFDGDAESIVSTAGDGHWLANNSGILPAMIYQEDRWLRGFDISWSSEH